MVTARATGMAGCREPKGLVRSDMNDVVPDEGPEESEHMLYSSRGEPATVPLRFS
jgi:hypothetical protein